MVATKFLGSLPNGSNGGTMVSANGEWSGSFYYKHLTLRNLWQKTAITLQDKSGIKCLAFSPDSQLLALGSHERIQLWNLATGFRVRLARLPKEVVSHLAFTPDGSTLISCSNEFWENENYKFWRVPDLEQFARVLTRSYGVRCLAISADGKTFVSGSSDYALRIWNLAERKRLATLRSHRKPINALAFSPDGLTLASASADGTFKLWDMATYQETVSLGTQNTSRHNGIEVKCLAFSRNGKLLASCESGHLYTDHLKLWDLEGLQEITTIKTHCRNLAIVSNDEILMADGYGGINLWKLEWQPIANR